MQEIIKNNLFINSLASNKSRFTLSQRKIVDNLLEKSSSKSNEESKEPKVDETEEKKPSKPIQCNYIVNTSAFSRKTRQSELKADDGFRLLTDVLTFRAFSHQLSLDIRDVFDDNVSYLLLSNQSAQRLSAVSILGDIFESKPNNFINSVDIVIRWCCIQFIGRHLSVSQASLLLLLNNLRKCDKLLTTKEVFIITPIILWCIATQSDAFTELLHEIKRNSSEEDYSEALLESIKLEHNAIISTIFEELKELSDISKIKTKLQELSKSDNSLVQHESKLLLSKFSQRPSNLSHADPITVLQEEILHIKTNPNDSDEARSIFDFIYAEFEGFPTDPRHLRYLLYCTYAFLSEPILSSSVENEDLISLLTLLCDFSLQCPVEFTDALNSIGFILVSISTSLHMFESLIEFIDNHIETETRRSFSFQMFNIGVSLIAVSQTPNYLSQLRIFAKSIIGQSTLRKDDIRAILCRSLLAEIVSLEQQKLMDIEQSHYQEELLSSLNVQQNEVDEGIDIDSDEEETNDLDDFLNILKRLTKQETKSNAIKELIAFDDRMPQQKIVEIVKRLSPTIGREIEIVKGKQQNSRPSSRASMNRSFH
ncbi:hypothetical protein GPJ56_007017 [Histomonas meleagridis]|nr:hypothetical protein GPJ56_007017 [Histomonas meleagridis]